MINHYRSFAQKAKIAYIIDFYFLVFLAIFFSLLQKKSTKKVNKKISKKGVISELNVIYFLDKISVLIILGFNTIII